MDARIKITPLSEYNLQEFTSEEAFRHLREGRIVRFKGENTHPKAVELIHASIRSDLLTHLKYKDHDSLRSHYYITIENAYYDFYWITTEMNVKENQEAIHLLTEKDPFSE